MVSINLYQSGKVNCNINFPTEWNELYPEELFAVCKRQLAPFKTIHEQIAAIFNDIFLLRSKALKKHLPADFQLMLDPDDCSMNADLLVNFLYKENRLTAQLLPVLKLPGFLARRMYGPESDFNNITCGEFEDAEFFFHEFVENPRPDPLAHLAAILWRPHNTAYMQFSAKTNKWVVYDHEKFYRAFLLLPQHILYAMFVWYAGCRGMMPLIFPTVYKKESGAKKSQPDLMAFTKCIHGAAGPKNGSRDEIRRTLLKEFFMELELEAITIEKQIENAKH